MCVLVFYTSVLNISFQIFNLNFLDTFSKNTQIPNLMKNPSSGSRVVPFGRTDGQEKAHTRFSQFCKRA
jgi:hypothetical protein